MWLLLVLGALAVVAASRSPRAIVPASRQIGGEVMPRGVPGPISVLGEIIRSGQYPPPTVILCAIAEAQAIGRLDLASDIVKAFVAPVVRDHEQRTGRHMRESCRRPLVPSAPPMYERGSCAVLKSPRAQADSCAKPTPATAAPYPVAAPVAAPAAAPQMAQRHASQEELLAMLHTDPKTFISIMESGRPPMVEMPIAAPPVASSAQENVQPTGLPPETVAQMQEASGLHGAADRTRALLAGSPIPNVSDEAWRQFVMRLEREEPGFQSSRHVGQFRQRRDRLAELGIDANTLVGSPEAQRAALDADLTDAQHHAAAGGLFDDHLGRSVTVPGHDGPLTITPSGLLGVIHFAGLEGAVGWLESANDRFRYPHTSQAFIRTNGVF